MNNWNFVLTSIQLVLLLCLNFALFYVAIQFWQAKKLIIRIIRHEQDKPSELQGVIDSISKTLAYHIAMQVKTVLMGKLSAASREEKALETAVAQDSNPVLFSLIEQMPAVKKLVSKNPALLGLALNYFKSKSGVNHTSQASTGEVKFNLG